MVPLAVSSKVGQVVHAVCADDGQHQVDCHVANQHGASLAEDAANQSKSNDSTSYQGQDQHKPTGHMTATLDYPTLNKLILFFGHCLYDLLGPYDMKSK